MATAISDGRHNTREKFEAAAVGHAPLHRGQLRRFRIMVSDAPSHGSGTFGSLISDTPSGRVNIGDFFRDRGYDQKMAPMYATDAVGMVDGTGSGG